MSSSKDSLDHKSRVQQKEVELNTPPTKRTPEIYLDKEEGLFKVSGRSRPTRMNEFFFPVMRKLEEYIQNPNPNTKVIFSLEYVDSGSSKMLLNIVLRLKKLIPSNNLTIQWNYAKDDDDIYELGKTYSELSGLEFDFIEVE